MLLAVLELAERGALDRNQVLYEATLESFAAYFDAIRRDGDHGLAYLPFLRLQGDGFWHLHARPGRTVHDAPRSHSAIGESFEHASLDSELHRLFLDPHARRELRAALLDWFPERREALNALIDSRRSHQRVRKRPSARREDSDRSRFRQDDAARDPAFRRLVLEAYDYRCAASGWRLIVPGGPALADAAHLVPFSETRDDHPRNGIALTPTFHRALDARLIAPGPDMRWCVSEVLDKRIPDNRPLVELARAGRHLPRPQANIAHARTPSSGASNTYERAPSERLPNAFEITSPIWHSHACTESIPTASAT